MRNLSNINDKRSKYNTIYILVSKKKEIVCIFPGFEGNVLDSEKKMGYKDSVFCSTYDIRFFLMEIEKRTILFKENFTDKYSCTEECIKDVLREIYDDEEENMEYILLTDLNNLIN